MVAVVTSRTIGRLARPPAKVSGINPNSPLSEGLLGAIVYGETNRDVVTGQSLNMNGCYLRPPSNTSGSNEAGLPMRGLQIRTADVHGGTRELSAHEYNADIQHCSLLSWHVIDRSPAQGSYWPTLMGYGPDPTSSTNRGYWIIAHNPSYNSHSYEPGFSNHTTHTYANAGDADVSLGVVRCVGGRMRSYGAGSVIAECFVDGVDDNATLKGSTTTDVSWEAGGVFGPTRRYSGSNLGPKGATHYFCVAWDRMLSDEEFWYAYAPSTRWEMYVPDRFPVYFLNIESGGTVTLDATSASTSGNTAELYVTRPLDATSASTSGVEASLNPIKPLDATANSTSGNTAELYLTRPLDATSDSTSGSSAEIAIDIGLDATSASTSGLSAELGVTFALDATSASTSGQTAELYQTRPLDATSDSTSGSSSELTFQGVVIALDATSASTSGNTAELARTRGIDATSASTSGISAELAITLALDATSASSSGMSAELYLTRPLDATSSSTSANTAELALAIAFDASAGSTSANTAELYLTRPLDASAASTSGSTPAPTLTNNTELNATSSSYSGVSPLPELTGATTVDDAQRHVPPTGSSPTQRIGYAPSERK